MSVAVYANGMSIACKVADGKTIAAFPDVCLSPPSPPIPPIPYPNTAAASDTTDGSKTVQIGGEEVMLKDKSTFKTSNGDEAATKSFGMGVVTHQITGKAAFVAWSMDVKFEGENIPRHMDLMGHNESSLPENTPPWPYVDSASLADSSNACNKSGDAARVADNCDGPPEDCYTLKCCEARKCVLVPYSPNKCCPKGDGQRTPHHVVPKAQFKGKGASGLDLTADKYNSDKAPCVCEEGASHSTGNHGDIHEETNNLTVNHPLVIGSVTGKTISADARWPVSAAEGVGAQATSAVTKCDADCIESQARNGHQKMGIGPSHQIRPSTAGRVTQPPANSTPAFE